MWIRIQTILSGGLPPWQAGRRLWHLWFAATGVAVVLAIGGGHAWWRAVMQAKAAQAQAIAEAALQAARASEPAVTAQNLGDFTARLPSTLNTEPTLAKLQRSCTQADVKLLGVQVQHRAGTAEQLARAELSVSLRGRYPAIKQVLGETLSQQANLTLHRLSIRALADGAAPPGEVEASMQLTLWGAPLRSVVPAGTAHSTPPR